MNQKPAVSRHAAFEDGRLVALVADGVPEWSDDLSSVEDANLPELESTWLGEFERLAADPEATEVDLQAAADHVRAVRDEAATRMAAAGDAEGEPEGGGSADPAAPAEPDLAAGDGDEPSRDELLTQLRAGMAPEPAPVVLPEPGVTREELVAAVAEGARATAAAVIEATNATALAVIEAARPAEPATVPAQPRRAADLGGYRPAALAPAAVEAPARRGAHGDLNPRLQTCADVPGMALGQEVANRDDLILAFTERLAGLGSSTGVSDEKMPIVRQVIDVPEDRNLNGLTWTEARRKVQEVMASTPYDESSVEAGLVASGGLSAPVQPYYEQLVIAQADRPVQRANPSFVADRGGIKLVLPPSIGSVSNITPTGQFSDGVTNTDTSLVSATAAFTASDVGSPVVGTGIPVGTIIASRTNATTVVLSAATTATATGVTFRIINRNPYYLGAPVGVVTAAQDASGPPTTVKFTYDVPLGTQAEFDVYSVYTSLQFANLTARTNPEQVDAYLRVTDALHARVADTQMLDIMTAWSTLVTGAQTFGTARQLLAQIDHLLAFYRNLERTMADAPLVVGLPAWSINAMRGDFVSTFLGDGWSLSEDELVSWFVERQAMPYLYLDGPSDVSQLFATSALAAATNTGTNSATPTPIPDYPGSGATTSFRTKVVSFVYAPGTFLNLTTGELNLGLVRDSILNSQNRFRNFVEEWETPAFVGTRALRCVHTVAANGTYGAAATITLGVGSGI